MAAAAQVIQSAAAAEMLLNSERLRLLENLTEPDSASGLARRLQIPRQKVNYHLRELEKHGFVELAEERRKGNCIERVMRATARSYYVSPVALGKLGAASASDSRDQFSSAYLVAAAARALRDVAILRGRADRAGKRLATLTMESEVRFASAETRKAFADELLGAVAHLVKKYHDDQAGSGRAFRFLLGAYPVITKPEPDEQASIRFDERKE